jgi:hypothetical protein
MVADLWNKTLPDSRNNSPITKKQWKQFTCAVEFG